MFLIALLKAKQPEIAALLSQADFNISTQQFYNDVYEAMAHSLGEAWRDLNRLLEKRKQLLEDAVNFHKNINDVSTVTIYSHTSHTSLQLERPFWNVENVAFMSRKCDGMFKKLKIDGILWTTVV